MPIKEELKEVSALKRKQAALKKSMDSALTRKAQGEYKRYKQEYEAIGRALRNHGQSKTS